MKTLADDDIQYLQSIVLEIYDRACSTHLLDDWPFLEKLAATGDTQVRETMLAERIERVTQQLDREVAALCRQFNPGAIRAVVDEALQRMRAPKG